MGAGGVTAAVTAAVTAWGVTAGALLVLATMLEGGVPGIGDAADTGGVMAGTVWHLTTGIGLVAMAGTLCGRGTPESVSARTRQLGISAAPVYRMRHWRQ